MPERSDPQPFSQRGKEFLAFAGGSAVGLGIDLTGFQLLVLLGLAPGLSNAVSSVASITAVYFLVTRFSFKVEQRFVSYAVFVAWYGMSILTFSVLIQFVVSETGWLALAVKLASVPVSFALNYLFSRYLFSRFQGPRPVADESESA